MKLVTMVINQQTHNICITFVRCTMSIQCMYGVSIQCMYDVWEKGYAFIISDISIVIYILSDYPDYTCILFSVMIQLMACHNLSGRSPNVVHVPINTDKVIKTGGRCIAREQSGIVKSLVFFKFTTCYSFHHDWLAFQ